MGENVCHLNCSAMSDSIIILPRIRRDQKMTKQSMQPTLLKIAVISSARHFALNFPTLSVGFK